MKAAQGAWPRSRHETIDFRLIFSAIFLVFLVVATVGRLLPRPWRPAGAAGRAPRSIIGEARAAANTFAPFAFMG